MWLRFAILSNLGVGLGALLYAWLLWRRDDRQALHARLSVFLTCLGIGLAARGLYWHDGWPWAGHVMWVAFALFPLPLALFFETLLHRALPLVLKLVVLFGSLALTVAALVAPVLAVPWWSGALVGFHGLVALWLGGLAFERWQKAKPGPLRRFWATAALMCPVSAGLIVTDWLHPFGLAVPRLGGVAAGLILYFGAANVHAGAEWRLRSSAVRFAATVALSGIAGLVVSALHPESSEGLWLSVVVALLGLGLVVEPIRLALTQSNAQTAEVVFERLATVPLRSASALTEALARWPEVQRLEHLSMERLAEGGYDRLADYFAATGNVASVHQVKLETVIGASQAWQRPLEQLSHLMEAFEVDYVAWLGPERGAVGVRFSLGLEERLYSRLFSVVALLYRLLPASPAPKVGP